ncbi:MAG: hypothetical protein IPM20_08705 [Gammaproteobacteria bacterium]|nr:hypothetical protein [Gammaproteobacteria bacterium]
MNQQKKARLKAGLHLKQRWLEAELLLLDPLDGAFADGAGNEHAQSEKDDDRDNDTGPHVQLLPSGSIIIIFSMIKLAPSLADSGGGCKPGERPSCRRGRRNCQQKQ